MLSCLEDDIESIMESLLEKNEKLRDYVIENQEEANVHENNMNLIVEVVNDINLALNKMASKLTKHVKNASKHLELSNNVGKTFDEILRRALQIRQSTIVKIDSHCDHIIYITDLRVKIDEHKHLVTAKLQDAVGLIEIALDEIKHMPNLKAKENQSLVCCFCKITFKKYVFLFNNFQIDTDDEYTAAGNCACVNRCEDLERKVEDLNRKYSRLLMMARLPLLFKKSSMIYFNYRSDEKIALKRTTKELKLTFHYSNP